MSGKDSKLVSDLVSEVELNGFECFFVTIVKSVFYVCKLTNAELCFKLEL